MMVVWAGILTVYYKIGISASSELCIVCYDVGTCRCIVFQVCEM